MCMRMCMVHASFQADLNRVRPNADQVVSGQTRIKWCQAKRGSSGVRPNADQVVSGQTPIKWCQAKRSRRSRRQERCTGCPLQTYTHSRSLEITRDHSRSLACRNRLCRFQPKTTWQTCSSHRATDRRAIVHPYTRAQPASIAPLSRHLRIRLLPSERSRVRGPDPGARDPE